RVVERRAVDALDDIAVLQAQAAEDAVLLDLEEPEAGGPAVGHLRDGSQLGHQPAHVVDGARQLAPIDDERVGAGPAYVGRSRREVGRAMRVVLRPGAMLSRWRELEGRLLTGLLEGDPVPGDRHDACAADRVAHAVELLAVRREVLDHGMPARSVNPDAPEPQSLRDPTVGGRGGIEHVARRDDAVRVEGIEGVTNVAGTVWLERRGGHVATRSSPQCGADT